MFQVGVRGCGQIGPKWDLKGKSIPLDKGRPASGKARRRGITAILKLNTTDDPQRFWKDSYSVNGRCYCASNYDHGVRDTMYETPQGWHTIETICQAMGPGPGINSPGAILYNDVQCGHLNNDRGDEDSDYRCPGRVDVSALNNPIVASHFRAVLTLSFRLDRVVVDRLDQNGASKESISPYLHHLPPITLDAANVLGREENALWLPMEQ